MYCHLVWGSVGLVLFFVGIWGMYNMLTEHYLYQGPTPLASLAAVILLYNIYKAWKACLRKHI